MKEPRVSDLKMDVRGTGEIRRRMASSRSVKITININRDSLADLRSKGHRRLQPDIIDLGSK